MTFEIYIFVDPDCTGRELTDFARRPNGVGIYKWPIIGTGFLVVTLYCEVDAWTKHKSAQTFTRRFGSRWWNLETNTIIPLTVSCVFNALNHFHRADTAQLLYYRHRTVNYIDFPTPAIQARAGFTIIHSYINEQRIQFMGDRYTLHKLFENTTRKYMTKILLLQ